MSPYLNELLTHCQRKVTDILDCDIENASSAPCHRWANVLGTNSGYSATVSVVRRAPEKSVKRYKTRSLRTNCSRDADESCQVTRVLRCLRCVANAAAVVRLIRELGCVNLARIATSVRSSEVTRWIQIVQWIEVPRLARTRTGILCVVIGKLIVRPWIVHGIMVLVVEPDSVIILSVFKVPARRWVEVRGKLCGALRLESGK